MPRIDSHQATATSSNETNDQSLAWFCLNSQRKHEHITAAHLHKMEGVEVFLPRIRFKRTTRRGIVWVTEALFPGYLFVRFNWQNSWRQVHFTKAARGIVHFGDIWPSISEATIHDLRQLIGDEELITISPELSPGDVVQISDGSFRGLAAVISRVMPSQERVAVLMDFLGSPTVIELKIGSIVKEADERIAAFGNEG